jgi:protein-arginine kinase activator protein McsA
MDTKKCTKCGQVKALDAFSAHKNAPDGKQYVCKECQQEYWSNHYHARKKQSKATENDPKPLAAYTSRQLMQELKSRGYTGTLKYTQEIKLETL